MSSGDDDVDLAAVLVGIALATLAGLAVIALSLVW